LFGPKLSTILECQILDSYRINWEYRGKDIHTAMSYQIVSLSALKFNSHFTGGKEFVATIWRNCNVGLNYATTAIFAVTGIFTNCETFRVGLTCPFSVTRSVGN